MANFNKIYSKSGTIDYAGFIEVDSSKYKNLPKAEINQYGVVKIDGTTIIFDKNGCIKVNTDFKSEDIDEHIKDDLVHLNSKDKENLSVLKLHLANTNIHFTVNEKKELMSTLDKHLKLYHLTEKETQDILEHIATIKLHFDTEDQKKQFIEAMKSSVKIKQDLSNKILITDTSKNVTLSNLNASVLENLIGLTEPIEDLLEKYSLNTHTHKELVSIDDLNGHKDDITIHFEVDEKEKVLNSLIEYKEKTEDSLKSIKDIYSTINKTSNIFTQRKLNFRYIKDILYSSSIKENNFKWINCSVYRNGINIANNLQESSISSDMIIDNKLSYIDGDTTNIAHSQTCTCLDKHFIQIDLGQVYNDISHIVIWHGINDLYEMKTLVSVDGDKWIPLYDTDINPTYIEDVYGKIHITNYEAYTSLYLENKTEKPNE